MNSSTLDAMDCHDFQWIFDSARLTQTLADLEWPESVVECLKGVAAELGKDQAQRQRYLEFAESWYKGEKAEMEEPELSCWHALAVVSAYQGMYVMHQKRRIPRKITLDTMWDLPRRMLNFRETYGYWGFDAQPWLLNHVRGNLYQLGRLQYVPGDFIYPAKVYGTEQGLKVFASAGARCDVNGWMRKNEFGEVWEATLEEKHGQITGYPVDWRGRIERRQESIPASSPCVLDEQCKVAHIHIPMGEKLDIDACRRSMEQAWPFFKEYYPEIQIVALCCGSWLLDRAFSDFLPADSNIVRFGQLFTALPNPNATDMTHFRWAFGKGVTREKALEMQAKTSLQRAMQDYVNSGGELHCSAGFVLSQAIS